MFIDAKLGIVDFDLIKVSKSTSSDDFDKLSDEKVKKSVSKRGSKLYVFKEPIDAAGISMRASVFFYSSNAPEIELRPYGIQDCHEAFSASHKWLEAVLGVTIDGSHEIFAVKTDSMKLSSSVRYDVRGGYEDGGSLKIEFC